MQPLNAARCVRSKTSLPPTIAAAHFHSATPLESRTRPRIYHRKKPEAPQPGRWWKPFEARNVILDLDSYESNYTRPYDEAEEEAQSQKWALNPRREAMKKRIDEFNVGREAAKTRFDESQKRAWQPWRVSDLDIMTAALKGAPKQSVSPTDTERVQREVVERNGIPMSVCRDDQRLLEWLIHRKPKDPAVRTSSGELVRLLEEPTTAEGFHEVLTRLLTSNESSVFLFKNIGILSATIADVLDRRLARPAALLPILNSLLLRCQTNQYAFGSSLCNIGMKISAETFHLKALRLYLDYTVTKRYDISPTITMDILRPLHQLVVQGQPVDSFRLANNAGTDHSTNSVITPAFKKLLFDLLEGEGESQKTGSSKTFPCFREIIDGMSTAEELTVMYQELVDKVNPSHQDFTEDIARVRDETASVNP